MRLRAPRGTVAVLFALLLICNARTGSAQWIYEDAFPSLAFSSPTDLQAPPDGSNRLFVATKAGRIQVFANSSSASTTTEFLDLSDRIPNWAPEMGLLGMAFHPDFANNGWIFVNYSDKDTLESVIARFTVDPADPDLADLSSEVEILRQDQPSTSHNGGSMHFGPDGYLYSSFGDGGGQDDPGENGEDPTNLLGSIIRIDVDVASAAPGYGIPSDNPFFGNNQGIRDEIYAYGFRNPWRFSFDPLTGDLWAGDVGQDTKEEIDLVEAGGNFGWDVVEGSICHEPLTGCDHTGLSEPIWEYDHTVGGSITGGYVYRGSRNPGLWGRYVYGDYMNGMIWALHRDTLGNVTHEPLVDTPFRISTFGVDESGELLFCDYSEGKIYRLRPGSPIGTPTPASERALFELRGNTPNPFNPSTMIELTLQTPTTLRLEVLDARGRVVKVLIEGPLSAGDHAFAWNGTDPRGEEVASGVYFARASAAGNSTMKRMVLLK